MGRITINCYEMDFSSGVFHCEVSGIAFGFFSPTSAVTNAIQTTLYPFYLIPHLPSMFRKHLEVFCCAYCSIP